MRFCRSYSSGLAKQFNRQVAKDIERKWKNSVESFPTQRSENRNVYVVPMFPYPSGQLHMGHVRVYTISDCLARYAALQGHNVIHPIGWDAFGLPAENAALERDLDPKEWTEQNKESMRKQLNTLGCRFNWERELSTSDHSYYKWTQWIFLRLFQRGLVTRARSLVNWDPVDKTVLAEEQIDEQGRSWRSGAVVEKKVLQQWSVRIPQYSKELWDELRNLDWNQIVEIQRNWIGFCDVYRFHLKLRTTTGKSISETLDLSLEDPRDLLIAKYVTLKSTHILANLPETGSGTLADIYAVHPISGEALPIVINDDAKFGALLDCGLGFESIFSRTANLCPEMSILEIVRKANNEGWGGYIASRTLKDWVVSRQRYWGTPIPMINCPSCGPAPVPEDSLPVQLPSVHKIGLSPDGRSPLAQISDWVNVACPKCGGNAKRETDTLDTFFDSTWYFFRYLDPGNRGAPFDREKVAPWLPIDTYVGGKEHAVLHLFYARFIAHFLWKEGLLPQAEPIRRLLPQGMVKGLTYSDPNTGAYIPADQVQKAGKSGFERRKSGEAVVESWEKMSKSKHNGVDPTQLLQSIGTDLARLLTVADVSPRQERKWDLSALKGIENWLSRVWWIVHTYTEAEPSPVVNEEWEARLKENRNFFLRHVTFHMETTHNLNTALNKLIGLTNTLRKVPPQLMGNSVEFPKCLDTLVVMSSVFAPHIFAELWAHLHPNQGLPTKWPECDADAEFDIIYSYDRSKAFIGRIRVPSSVIGRASFSSALALGLEQLPDLRKILFGHSSMLDHEFIHFPSAPSATIHFKLDVCQDDLDYHGLLIREQ